MLATQATHRALRRPPGLHKHTKAQPSSRSRRIGGHFRQITKPLLSVVRKRAAYASSSRLHLHSLPYARARASSLLHCQPNQSALAAPPLPPPYPAPQVLQASSERAASRAMLQASSERAAPLPGAPRLWVPGMSTDAGPTTARAREITLRREEMLGMLRDLPEADYELSLTDLVDKTSAGAGVVSPPPPPASERKEASPCPSPRSLGPADQQQPTKAEKKGSSARRRSEGGSGSGSSFRSSSDGVLLNFYMPRSFTRSFTAPRPGRTPSASSSGRAASVAVVPEDCNKRERDGDAVRCWPLPWDRRWRKSSRRRQDPASTSGELTAILTAADHTAPADKA